MHPTGCACFCACSAAHFASRSSPASSTTRNIVSASACWYADLRVCTVFQPPAAATSTSGRCFRSVAHLRRCACQRLPYCGLSFASSSALRSHRSATCRERASGDYLEPGTAERIQCRAARAGFGRSPAGQRGKSARSYPVSSCPWSLASGSTRRDHPPSEDRRR